MSLVERLFVAAQRAAKYLKNDREPMKSFAHDAGSVSGWYVCTTESSSGVGWATRTEILLADDGTLYQLYIHSVNRADSEGRMPCRMLRKLTAADPWPDLHKRTVLQKLQEMMV